MRAKKKANKRRPGPRNRADKVLWLLERLLDAIFIRLQGWTPSQPPASLRAEKQAGPGPLTEARSQFEYDRKLAEQGFKLNPDGEGVIHIETGELWDSVEDYRDQRRQEEARIK